MKAESHYTYSSFSDYFNKWMKEHDLTLVLKQCVINVAVTIRNNRGTYAVTPGNRWQY